MRVAVNVNERHRREGARPPVAHALGEGAILVAKERERRGPDLPCGARDPWRGGLRRRLRTRQVAEASAAAARPSPGCTQHGAKDDCARGLHASNLLLLCRAGAFLAYRDEEVLRLDLGALDAIGRCGAAGRGALVLLLLEGERGHAERLIREGFAAARRVADSVQSESLAHDARAPDGVFPLSSEPPQATTMSVRMVKMTPIRMGARLLEQRDSC